jgi:NTP pyrophosphatase (non-canonical NTP hydrolase)
MRNLQSQRYKMKKYNDIITQLLQFRDERDWKQFHDSKNLATAISIEAAELNELFLWKTIKESDEVDINKIKEELADVLAFAFLLAEKHGLDPFEIVAEKIKLNAEKYPVDKAKGTATKYTDL